MEKEFVVPENMQKVNSSSLPLNLNGRIIPQAQDLEEIVLGALIIDTKGVDEVIDIITPEIFYNPKHKEIFRAIFDLFKKSEPIDIKTLTEQLKKNKKYQFVGGEFYLIKLSNLVSSSAHIEYHTRIILQQYIKRELIAVCADIEKKAFDESTDVFNLLDKAESKLFDITNGNIKKSSEKADSLVNQALKKIQIAAEKDVSGVPTGFKGIDDITSGWQSSDLVIIAARPGMGKTAFVLSMARNIALDKNIPVAIFSLEMSSVQMIMRLISSETGLSSEKLKQGKLQPHEWTQLYTKISALEKAPIFIDDTPALSIFDLRAKCRRLVSQHKVQVIVVDYLQLMSSGANSKYGNREQEIAIISRNLKALAKELNIPVIAISQLSRSVESRGGTKRPLLSDLRESGAIEQDADIVSFIYRPEYYGLDAWDDQDSTPCKGQAEFIIEKHRNGGTGSVRLRFIGSQTKFQDIDQIFSNQIESKINIMVQQPNEAFGMNDTNQDSQPF